MLKKFLPTLAALFFGQILAQNPAYEITLRLDGLTNEMVGFGYFFGNEQFLVDSARVDSTTHSVVFRGAKKLAEGMYFAGAGGQKLLDFMVDADQNFVLTGKTSSPDSIEVEGSDENRVFFAHKKAMSPLLEQLTSAQKMYDLIANATKDADVRKEFREKVNNGYRALNALTVQQMADNPGRLYTKMLKMGFNPDPPAEIEMYKEGRVNREYVDWLRDHYFDNVDFADGRLLYCNVFADRVGGFLQQFYPQTSDGTIEGCDFVLSKTAASPDFNHWAVVNLTRIFEQSDWGPSATVFVHLVDKYQQPKQQPWLDVATQMRLQYKADIHRPTLLGSAAPPMKLFNEKHELVDLRSIDAPWTMLVFYSPLCEHCQAQLPEIQQFYQNYKAKGMKCVAISTEGGEAAWQGFIKKQGWEWVNLIEPEDKSPLAKSYGVFNLPVIYILDKDKKIVARRVKTADLSRVMNEVLR